MAYRFLLLLALAACAGEGGGPEPDGGPARSDGRSDVPNDTLTALGLDAGVEVVAEGEEVVFKLRVANRGDRPVTFEFPSGQRYDFVVSGAGGESLWRWSAAALFLAEPGTVTLPPGDTLEYEERWAPGTAAGPLVVEASVTSLNLPIVRRADFTR